MFIALLFPFLGSRQDVRSLVSQMTLDEKVSLCHGGSDFGTKAIPRLGIPEYRFTDGPNGVRDQEQIPTTYFPTGVAMAASWDPEMIYRVGQALGEEEKGLGKSVLLAPAVNIDLTPLGGRTFEYESEDPFLNACICTRYIDGVQSQGVLACIKHYAVNSIEKERTTVDAQLSERTLREIYLPSFEAAVKEAHVGSVMAAYNKVNGQYCAENSDLLKNILKGDWGFKGFVMSDWGAVHSTVPTAMNGLDLQMPGDGANAYLGDPLLTAVRAGQVPESQIDAMVTRTLAALQGKEQPNISGRPNVSTAAHQGIALELAEDAMVLLKNDRGTLPLEKSAVHTLAVIGPNADLKFGGSGGSGSVITPFEVTPLQGLKTFLGSSVDVRFAPGSDMSSEGDIVPTSVLQTPDGRPGLLGAYYAKSVNGSHVSFRGEPAFTRVDPAVRFDWDRNAPKEGFPREYFSVRWTGFLVPQETGTYDLSTTSDDGSRVSIDGKEIVNNWGFHGSVRAKGYIRLEAGHKYAIRVDYFQGMGGAEVEFDWKKLPSGRRPWIDQAVQTAKEADAVILVVGANHDQDSEGGDKDSLSMADDMDDLTEAVLDARPDAVVVLINGTPIAMPWIAKAHSVLEAWYPGMEGGSAIASVLFGQTNPAGKLPVTFPKKLSDSPAHALGDYPPKNGVFKYDEGVLVGYRWYDTKRIEPLFPFGFGLSYTSFKISDARVRPSHDGAEVTASVSNVGSRAGAEVVEVYVAEPGAKVIRPEKELKGFRKVFLQPRQIERIDIHLNKRAFEYYSESQDRWVEDGGNYRVLVGNSSRDIVATGIIALAPGSTPNSGEGP